MYSKNNLNEKIRESITVRYGNSIWQFFVLEHKHQLLKDMLFTLKIIKYNLSRIKNA